MIYIYSMYICIYTSYWYRLIHFSLWPSSSSAGCLYMENILWWLWWMSHTDSVILIVMGSPKFTKTMNVIQRPSVKTFCQPHQKCHLVSVKVKGSEKSLRLIHWWPLIKNVSIQCFRWRHSVYWYKWRNRLVQGTVKTHDMTEVIWILGNMNICMEFHGHNRNIGIWT